MGSVFSSQDPADIGWRSEQMAANNRIEGIERDPEYAHFMDGLEAQGVPIEERIRLLGEFIRRRCEEKRSFPDSINDRS